MLTNLWLTKLKILSGLQSGSKRMAHLHYQNKRQFFEFYHTYWDTITIYKPICVKNGLKKFNLDVVSPHKVQKNSKNCFISILHGAILLGLSCIRPPLYINRAGYLYV